MARQRYDRPMARRKYQFFDPQDAARLAQLGFVARQPVEGSVGGLHRSPHHGFSVEFADHREYVPGDDLRHLDWTAYARTDRYYIKRYEQETNLSTHILLDTSASMGFGSGEVTKFEYACRFACMLAFVLARQLDQVGLVTFDDQPRISLQTGSTPRHLDRLFKELETIEPGRQTRLSEVLHRVAEMTGRRGLIVLISDLYDEPADVLKALRHFQHLRHQIMVVHVLDRAELTLPGSRVTTFIDMETRQRVQIDPKVLRDAYRREVESFINAYRRGCGESAIDYRLAPTDHGFADTLRNYLASFARGSRR